MKSSDVTPVFKKANRTRNQQAFATRLIHIAHYGSNSLSYLGPKIWEMVASNAKNLGTVKAFIFAIKRWLPENYPCRLGMSIKLAFYEFLTYIYISNFSSVSTFSRNQDS